MASLAAAAPSLDEATAPLEELLHAAFAAQMAGDNAAAERLIAVAHERFPEARDPLELRMLGLVNGGDYAGALAVVDGWLAAHPDDNDWQYVKAAFLLHLGREEEAFAVYRRLGEAGDHDAYFALGEVYTRGTKPDYGGAIAAYEAGMAACPPAERAGHAYVNYNLACLYAKTGEPAKGYDKLKEAFAADPYLVVKATDEPDLLPLRSATDFDELVATARAQAKVEAAKTPPAAALKPGDAAPPFRLRGTDGQDHRLADFRGSYVVLNFWATWCPPCRGEIPVLAAFAEKHRKDNVAVVGIAEDTEAANLTGFLQLYGAGYPVLLDDGSAAASYLGADVSLPQTFFIDRESAIRRHVRGSMDADGLETRFQEMIKEAP